MYRLSKNFNELWCTLSMHSPQVTLHGAERQEEALRNTTMQSASNPWVPDTQPVADLGNRSRVFLHE